MQFKRRFRDMPDMPSNRFWQAVNRNRASKLAFILAAGAAACVVLQISYLFATAMPQIDQLQSYKPAQSVLVYDRFDKLAAVVPLGQDRIAVPLSQISKHMQHAMLASEDHLFYKHDGVNLVSIGRAALVNLSAGHVVEGGSTITQQLAKNLFFQNQARTFDRKIKELVLALSLERRYSKDQILEMYLNQVYFGRQAYGIESAARRFFGKPDSQLTMAESAYLAGLVRAPSAMATRKNLEDAVNRQQIVLDKMAEYGFAKKTETDQAKNDKLAFRRFIDPYERYPHYVSYVVQQLQQEYRKDVLDDGIKVYTNLDPQAQLAAEKALNDGVKTAPAGVSQAALVSINVKDGGVIAMVGGVGNYYKHQWNRAVSPHTAGSSFKPFVYLAAFMQGVMPETIIKDDPLTVDMGQSEPPYSPKNFDDKYLGKITVREALAKSRNLCSIRLMQLVGPDNVVSVARKAGIKNAKLDPYLSLALGASAVSPMEMATAYSTFARQGVYMQPTVIRRVEDGKGQVLSEAKPESRRVFDRVVVGRLVDVMMTAVESGTGMFARMKGRQVAGKTGTADDSKDIWFVGYTPDMCTAVWGGNDENDKIKGRNVTGGVVMARMWKDYASRYYATHTIAPIAFNLPKKGEKPQTFLAFVGDKGSTKEEKDAKPALAPNSQQSTQETPSARRIAARDGADTGEEETAPDSVETLPPTAPPFVRQQPAPQMAPDGQTIEPLDTMVPSRWRAEHEQLPPAADTM